jgi:metallo-beta-lactamase class B
MRFLALSILACVLAFSAFGQQSEEDRRWNTPVEPFNIVGNVYYVGAAEITSYLITTPKGHIIIDAGFSETVPQIVANVKKLGFDPKDIKILLNTQAHYDHAGGFAELKRLTGAKMMASEADKSLLERGGRNDFAFGDRFPYEPVKADKIIRAGVSISLGGVSLTPLVMPGHTKGATSYLYETKEAGKRYQVLFFSSVSTPGYQLVGNKDYPDLVDDLQKTIARVKKLSPDVFLASHASFFDLLGKAERLKKSPGSNPFIDKAEFTKFIAGGEQAFLNRLEEQRKSNPAPKGNL